ncbi:TPA: hypothetical protein DEP90_00895 [Patescibacteria group bacterium]|nr:hypothetical protein [Patescibacteria group bacterium]
MSKEKTPIQKNSKISVKRIAIALSLVILLFTSLAFGYLYFDEIENNSVSNIGSEKKEEPSLTEEKELEVISTTECEKKNIGVYDWVSYLSKENGILYYNEVNKDDDSVCKYKIYSTPDKKLVQSPHLHIREKKVTFFLTDYDYETAQYYIVDLIDDSVLKTDITIDYDGANYRIKYSGTDYYDKYIVSYPAGSGQIVEEYKTLWASGTIYVLNTDGESYEIPCNTLPYDTSLIFTKSSSPDLLAITLSGDESNIEAYYNLRELLK